jgi:RNA polymerase II subunit A small phosphatase-like protein
VYKRPGVDRFLENCLKRFEVGVWTSATRDYAQEIIRNLFGDIRKLSFLWCREKCTPRINNDENSLTFRSRYYVKDLKKFKKKGYPLEKIIVVEDSYKAVSRNYGNAVIVREYRGMADDDELFRLSDYLKILGSVENVREIEKRNWRSVFEEKS